MPSSKCRPKICSPIGSFSPVSPQGIEIPSLADAELKLVEGEREYIRQRGLTPGHESLLLQDPAGNWIELFEVRRIG